MSDKKVTMDAVIDRLFHRLGATYGASWTRQIGNMPIGDVKTVWMHELAGYHGSLGAIAYALEHLPERCPNVIEFRNICRAAPSVQTLQIERPKADPAIVAMALQAAAATQKAPGLDEKNWAHKNIARHKAGEKINPTTLLFSKQALGMSA